MKSTIIRIGNSRGIRIPKALLDQSGLAGQVDVRCEGKSIVIEPLSHPREGWDAAFREMAANGDDKLLDADALPQTEWEKAEWHW